MTPGLSRQLGFILGTHLVTWDERDQIATAAEQDPVDVYEDLPRNVRVLLEEIMRR